MDPSPVARRYFRDTLFSMGFYIALNAAAMAGVLDRLSPAARWAFALLVAAPVAIQIWAALVYMRDSDEFVRALTAKRFVIAAGGAFAVAAAWGFAESYAGAAHAPAWLIYPLFWGFFGAVTPFVRDSH